MCVCMFLGVLSVDISQTSSCCESLLYSNILCLLYFSEIVILFPGQLLVGKELPHFTIFRMKETAHKRQHMKCTGAGILVLLLEMRSTGNANEVRMQNIEKYIYC